MEAKRSESRGGADGRTLGDAFVCSECPSDGSLSYRPAAEPGAGAYVCGSCAAWWPREHWIADFSPPSLREDERWTAFHRRFGAVLGLQAFAVNAEPEPASLQREHFDEVAEQYEAYLQRSSFWRAHDQLVAARWIKALPPNTNLIDVGAGTGRCFVPIVQHLAPGPRLVAVDISFEVLRVTADRLRELGLIEDVELAVADARSMPFLRADSFDAAFLYDLLHHLDEKEPAFAELERLLRPGGALYIRDNNESGLRSLFDLLMRFWRLWDAEHEGHPVTRMEDLERWADEAGFDLLENRSSVFLPPHVFDLLPLGAAKALLRFTEAIGRHTPGLSRHGGMIVAEARRRPG